MDLAAGAAAVSLSNIACIIQEQRGMENRSRNGIPVLVNYSGSCPNWTPGVRLAAVN